MDGCAQEVKMPGDIHIITERIPAELLDQLVRESFGVMVKYVVDIEQEGEPLG